MNREVSREKGEEFPSGALFLWRRSLVKRANRTGTHTPSRGPERGVEHAHALSLQEG